MVEPTIPASSPYYRARHYDQSVGRFLGEDSAGFADGVNFYRYVHNNPGDGTDPSGLTTFKGFPADLEVQLRNAVDEALKKLKETCPSCAGKDGPKIANYIENGTFVFQPKSKKCGHTGPVSFLKWRHEFGLGPAAFGPACCSLASTLVHEVVHGHPIEEGPLPQSGQSLGRSIWRDSNGGPFPSSIHVGWDVMTWLQPLRRQRSRFQGNARSCPCRKA